MMHVIRLGADVPDLPCFLPSVLFLALGRAIHAIYLLRDCHCPKGLDRRAAHPSTPSSLQPLPNKLTSKNVFANLAFQAGTSGAPKSMVQDSAKAEHLKSQG